MSRVRVTSADFNGHDFDGSPFDVRGAGEAWPGDHIVHGGGRIYSIEKAAA
jgi:hypothetical protein